MSPGYETRDRRERRHREDRHRDPRDAYPIMTRGGAAYPPDYPPEYTSDPLAYQPPVRERGHASHRPRRAHREHDDGGLNAGYYSETPEPHDSSSRRRHGGGGGSRRTRDPERLSRRSQDRYDSHHYAKPVRAIEDDDDPYFGPKPRRRTKTIERDGRGRSSHRRYDTDYTDDEQAYSEHEARPVKPSRSKSFMNAMGMGKADRHPEKADRHLERSRGRSQGARSRSRGRVDRRYSFSPPRRHRSAHGGKSRAAGVGAGLGGLADGIRRSNTNWQHAAGSAVKAGASAAYELRHDPSPWVGPKGFKIATAALGAVVMENMMEDKRSKKSDGLKSAAMKSLGEAALKQVISSSSGSDKGKSSRRRN